MRKFDIDAKSILYLDEESSEGLSQDRFKKLLKGRGTKTAPSTIVHGVQVDLRVDEEQSVKKLKMALDTYSPQMVVIDSLVRIHGGDENSAKDMAKVNRVIKKLAHESGCVFVIADHERKQGRTNQGGAASLRGSTEKLGAIDSLLSLSKSKQTLKLNHSKSRCGPEIGPIKLQIIDQQNGGVVIESENHAKARPSNELNRLSPIEEIIKAHKGGASRGQVLEKASAKGISTKRADNALKNLDKSHFMKTNEKRTSGRGGPSDVYRYLGQQGV